MQIKSRQTLTKALAGWGAHEAHGRLAGRTQVDTANPLACAELALQSRSPYVGRILLRDPLAVLEVELTVADIGNLVLADGRSLASWKADVTRDNGESAAHIQRLIDDSTGSANGGHLLCAATVVSDAPTLRINHAVLYDGWHRAAAFLERARRGRAHGIRGYLVTTREADRLLPVPQAAP